MPRAKASKSKSKPKPEPKVKSELRRYYGAGVVMDNGRRAVVFDKQTFHYDTSKPSEWAVLDKSGFNFEVNPSDKIVFQEPRDPFYGINTEQE